MTATNYWEQLEQLFHAVADMTLAQRTAYLDEHGVDAPLRAELEELISSGEDAKTGIATLLAQQTEQLTASGVEAGESFGPYRIVRLIAEGGMGAVFLAERVDGQFEQQVALKVLRSALPGEALMARFRHERQILSDLTHPNIATLLDGGTNERGLPYLVMEYVSGASIDRYCQDESISLRQRLELIQKVCGAVQAAHQSLIVHRDIKPNNIIVDATGTPKLLDFGIAKLLDEQEREGEALHTQAGQRMLTPEYASPEQIRGEAVGTASDVYSLGVVLYGLLTGRSPYERWRTQPLELQKAVCENDPPKPSDSVIDLETVQPSSSKAHTKAYLPPAVAAQFRRALKGDLDHIVLKAMRKEPAQRYSSPAALAEDIQRFLDQLPIAARRGSRSYVLNKYLRRNAVAVSSGVAVIVLITALVVFYTQRLQRERDVAQRERVSAEKVSDFMVELFEAGNPEEQKPDLLAREVLHRGADRLQSELADQPLIEARLQQAIGQAYWSLQLFDDGEARAKRALQLLRDHLPAHDLAIADQLNKMGRMMVRRERYQDGLDYSRHALEIYEAQYGENHRKVADVLMDIHKVISQRDHKGSEEDGKRIDKAIRIYKNVGMQDTRELSVTFAAKSAWHKQRFEWAAALDAVNQGLAILYKLGEEGEWKSAFHLEDRARLEYFMGDYRSARTDFQHVIRIIERYKGSNSVDLTWSTYYLALIERETGHVTLARELMQRTVSIESATPLTDDNRYLARALCGLALIQADAGEWEQAQANCERGRDILQKTLETQQRVRMDVIHEGLGVVALARGDVETAVSEFTALASIRRAEDDPGQTDTPLAIGMLASALAALGKLDDAQTLFNESIGLAETRYGPDYPSLGRLLWARAYLREKQADVAGAADDRARAKAIFTKQAMQPQSEIWTISAG